MSSIVYCLIIAEFISIILIASITLKIIRCKNNCGLNSLPDVLIGITFMLLCILFKQASLVIWYVSGTIGLADFMYWINF